MNVVIVGAGPAGLGLAIDLASQPNNVRSICIVEQRSKKEATTCHVSNRNWSLILSPNGLEAMKYFLGDSYDEYIKSTNPYNSVSIHLGKSKIKQMANAKSDPRRMTARNQISYFLYKKLETTELAKKSQIDFYFESACTKVDAASKRIFIRSFQSDCNQSAPESSTTTLSYDLLIAADGASSVVREEINAQDEDLVVTKLANDAAHKLLRMSNLSKVTEEGAMRFDPWTSVHFGVSKPYRIITTWLGSTRDDSADDLDGSNGSTGSNGVNGNDEDMFGGAFIFKKHEMEMFEIGNKQALELLEERFPWFAAAMSEQDKESFVNEMKPTATADSIKCSKFDSQNSIVLLGDAAHHMTASRGQGCNCALESCMILAKILKEKNFKLEEALPLFTKVRIDDAHAITDASHESVQQQRNKWFLMQAVIVRLLAKNFNYPDMYANYTTQMRQERRIKSVIRVTATAAVAASTYVLYVAGKNTWKWIQKRQPKQPCGYS